MSEHRSPVVRLVGVYDADGTIRGELAYWIGARLGRTHCSLCEITHGLVRQRQDWKQRRAGLPVPFETYHRDDQPAGARAAGGPPPFVVAETAAGFVALLGPDELAACMRSPDHLVASLEAALERTGLGWP